MARRQLRRLRQESCGANLVLAGGRAKESSVRAHSNFLFIYVGRDAFIIYIYTSSQGATFNHRQAPVPRYFLALRHPLESCCPRKRYAAPYDRRSLPNRNTSRTDARRCSSLTSSRTSGFRDAVPRLSRQCDAGTDARPAPNPHRGLIRLKQNPEVMPAPDH